MPADVFVDAGTFHPSLDGLTAAFVLWEVENEVPALGTEKTS